MGLTHGRVDIEAHHLKMSLNETCEGRTENRIFVVPGKVFAEDEAFDNADTTMEWLEAICKKLYQAEDDAHRDAFLKKWLEQPTLMWNQNSWTRDHLLNLDEGGFQVLPTHTKDEWEETFELQGSSEDIEMLHNYDKMHDQRPHLYLKAGPGRAVRPASTRLACRLCRCLWLFDRITASLMVLAF